MNLVSYDNAELLQLMAGRQDDESSARIAFDEFYARHLPWLICECRKRISLIPGRDVENFALDVLVDVYESKAKTFTRTQFPSALECERAVRGWLAKIAQNRARDRFRETDDIAEISNIEELYVSPEVEAERDDPNARCEGNDPKHKETPQKIQLAKQMIDELPDNDRAIIMTYLHFLELGKRIPPHVLKNLAEENSMSKEGVRKRFFRFRQEVKAAIQNLG